MGGQSRAGPSLLALRLPALRLGGRWEALSPPLSVVPRLPADTTVFLFLLQGRAVLSSFRRAGEGCRVEIAYIKANTSCLSMMLRQGSCKKKEKFPLLCLL